MINNKVQSSKLHNIKKVIIDRNNKAALMENTSNSRKETQIIEVEVSASFLPLF